jgi:hypothetical protein
VRTQMQPKPTCCDHCMLHVGRKKCNPCLVRIVFGGGWLVDLDALPVQRNRGVVWWW